MRPELIVAGLDPSLTSFGVALVSVDGVRSKALSPKQTGVARLAWFRDQLFDAITVLEDVDSGAPFQQVWVPDLVVVEGYAYGKGAQAHQIGELGGVVRLALHDAGLPWVEVPPAKLKKFVTGKGNAKKDTVRLEAFKRFGFEARTVDEVEAVCLALMGWVGAGFPPKANLTKLPKANLSVLEDIEWPTISPS